MHEIKNQKDDQEFRGGNDLHLPTPQISSNCVEGGGTSHYMQGSGLWKTVKHDNQEKALGSVIDIELGGTKINRLRNVHATNTQRHIVEL